MMGIAVLSENPFPMVYVSHIDIMVILIVSICTKLCFLYHQNGLNGVRTSAALDSKLPTTELFVKLILSKCLPTVIFFRLC